MMMRKTASSSCRSSSSSTSWRYAVIKALKQSLAYIQLQILLRPHVQRKWLLSAAWANSQSRCHTGHARLLLLSPLSAKLR